MDLSTSCIYMYVSNKTLRIPLYVCVLRITISIYVCMCMCYMKPLWQDDIRHPVKMCPRELCQPIGSDEHATYTHTHTGIP